MLYLENVIYLLHCFFSLQSMFVDSDSTSCVILIRRSKFLSLVYKFYSILKAGVAISRSTVWSFTQTKQIGVLMCSKSSLYHGISTVDRDQTSFIKISQFNHYLWWFEVSVPDLELNELQFEFNEKYEYCRYSIQFIDYDVLWCIMMCYDVLWCVMMINK